MEFSRIKEDFELMREDFRRIGCSIRLKGGLKKRGYSEQDISLIMGENFMRVFKEVLTR